MLSRSGVLDVRPVTSVVCGGDNDGSDVEAGCGNWTGRGDDVGVADGADATGDAVLPADIDAGRNTDDGKSFRLTQHNYTVSGEHTEPPTHQAYAIKSLYPNQIE